MTAVRSLDEDMEEGLAQAAGVDGGASPALRRARAWLSRAAEPGSIPFWRFVDDNGPVEAVRRLRARRAPGAVPALVGARAGQDASLGGLGPAARGGARLVVPEDREWPGLLLHALTLATGEEPDDPRHQSPRTTAPVPPLALWVRGRGRLDELADR